jgi:hypothetical protein
MLLYLQMLARLKELCNRPFRELLPYRMISALLGKF